MQTKTYHVRIGFGRRIVLPNEVCKSMLFDVGNTLIVQADAERTTLTSVGRTVARFQSILPKRVPPGFSAVDEFIAEREDAPSRE